MQKYQYKMLFLTPLLLMLAFPLISLAQEDEPTYTQLSTEDGISVIYPEEWMTDVGEGDAFIFLYNNDAIIERANDAPFESGDVSIFLAFTPTEYAHLLGFVGETIEERLDNLANGLVILNTDETGNSQVNISEIMVNDLPEGQFITYAFRDVADGMIIMWNISDDLLGTAIITTAPNELEENRSTILSIMQSVTFNTTINALRNGGEE